MEAKRHAPQQKWIRAKSGNTYMCPADLRHDASDEEIHRHCIDESANPQNN